MGQQVIARARRRRPRPSRAQVTAEVVDRTLPSVRSLIRRLRALRPPEEDEARVDRFIDQVETATNLVREFARAARAGDRAKISELTTRFAEIAGPTRRFAQDYGLRDCLPEAGRT